MRERGFSLLPIPLTLAAAAAGLAVGIGAFTFHYGKGSSYMGNDPATCANCHVMSAHYAGWQAAAHHGIATCNDCHTPDGPASKYLVKARNGWNHSWAFTTGLFPDVIRARPSSTAVVEANCRRCHADLVDSMSHGGDVSCVRCHASVGHPR